MYIYIYIIYAGFPVRKCSNSRVLVVACQYSHLCAPKILHVPPSLTGCHIPFLQGDENPINIGNSKTKPNQNGLENLVHPTVMARNSSSQ